MTATQPAIGLVHRSLHDVVVDRDEGEGEQQTAGIGQQCGHGAGHGPG